MSVEALRCACGHFHIADVGGADGGCETCECGSWGEPVWDESQEGIQASRPEDLPVPPNADKRYEELDGG